MHSRYPKRGLGLLSASLMLAAAVIGCGGGAGSRNEDDGFYVDGRGEKTITRTLDNESDLGVDVTLEINGVDYLDTIYIPPDDFVNVTIERMRVEDSVWYTARFTNGATTSGRFGEDGRTVFTHRSSRAEGAAAASSTETNGKAAVKAGGRTIKLDASLKRRAGR
jgi:hypothetical protein